LHLADFAAWWFGTAGENNGAEREIFDQTVTGWRNRKSARVSRNPHGYAAIRNKKGQRITVDLYILVGSRGVEYRYARMLTSEKRCGFVKVSANKCQATH